jgi:arginyl-tRNA synthetase
MVDVRNVITKLISDAVVGIGVDRDVEITLEHPADLTHGDYSCNIAMRLAKALDKNPKDLAIEVVANLSESEYISRAEVAGAGFINLYLSEEFYESQIAEVISNPSEWGKVDAYTGKHMLIEHSSPNLFKPFHIGHLVNNSYGEALVRVSRAAGAEVVPLSFPSDVSPGIAKAVWGIIEMGVQDDFTMEQVGEAYTMGVNAYKDSNEAKERIDEINTNIYNRAEGTIEYDVYKRGRAISLESFNNITARLGSTFSELIFETEAEQVGKEIVRQHTPGVFEESEGAVIFRGSKYGLFDNVYINSAGFGTYLAKDAGLLSLKFSKYNFDKSITVTDVEQKQHFELVRKSAEFIDAEWAEKSLYLQHGRLALTTGKISSRSGGVPLATEIIDSVKERATQRAQESGTEMNDDVAEMIAIGAIKYAILKVSMGKNIVFDLEKSLSFEGDSGPYLQYTYARCKSVLARAYPHRGNHKVQVPQDWQTTNIERLLYRLPEVTERAALEYEPHHIANYLNELASAYNSWYGQGKILDGSDAEHYKLALTEAVAYTLSAGLNMLGIDTPERM